MPVILPSLTFFFKGLLGVFRSVPFSYDEFEMFLSEGVNLRFSSDI